MDAAIILSGEDITQDLEPFLESVRYEDKLSGEADALELTLNNATRLFMGDWLPPIGATIAIAFKADAETLDLGKFEIDELTFSAPPSICRVKAVSISQNSGLRQVDESKSWENVLLSKICADIAEASGVELFYDCDFDPKINRAEQGEQSRLAFLEKICADYGLICKFSDGKLIVFEEEKLEQSEPALTLNLSSSIVKRYSVTTTLQEIYKACEVNYQHAAQDTLYKARAEDATKSTGKTLKVNRKVNSQAEADRLAANELRKKNKKETQMTLTTLGDFRLVAGNVLELEEFGKFSGRWLIEEAVHTLGGGGYECSLKLRRHKNE